MTTGPRAISARRSPSRLRSSIFSRATRTRVRAIPAAVAGGWAPVVALRALCERDEVEPPLHAASKAAAKNRLKRIGNLQWGGSGTHSHHQSAGRWTTFFYG